MDTFAIVFGIGLILLIILGGFWARAREKKAYNGGKCPDCKTLWRYYDTDSQGGRGYTCDTCPRGVWVSYPGIDR